MQRCYRPVLQRLVVAGGVACNSGVRSRMSRLAGELGIELHIPSPSLCGDNAAMLAVPGDYYLKRGMFSAPDLDVTATWEMDRIKESFLLRTRRPLKSLGQNFLVDSNIIDKIIHIADIKPEDSVLEIGPGRGALTEHLARKAGRLRADRI